MAKYTTLPFMDVEPQEDTGRGEWYRLYCRLCDYHTPAGGFYNCEMEAADHLDAEHAAEREAADAQMMASVELGRAEWPDIPSYHGRR